MPSGAGIQNAALAFVRTTDNEFIYFFCKSKKISRCLLIDNGLQLVEGKKSVIFFRVHLLLVRGTDFFIPFLYRRFFVESPCAELFEHTSFFKLLFEALQRSVNRFVVFNFYNQHLV
jgi:hypothetical protein